LSLKCQFDMAWHPRRLESWATLLWEPQVLLSVTTFSKLKMCCVIF